MFPLLDAYLEKARASADDAGRITPLPETRRKAFAGEGIPSRPWCTRQTAQSSG